MLITPIINKHIVNTPITVLQPNGTSIISTHTCELPLDILSQTARREHIIPAFTSGALLSLGQLCDNNCHAILHKYTIKYTKGKTLSLKVTETSPRECGLSLFRIPLYIRFLFPQPPPQLHHYIPQLLLHAIVIASTNRKRSKMWPNLYTLLVSRQYHKHSSKLSTPVSSHRGMTLPLASSPSTSPNVKQLLLATSTKPGRIFAAHGYTLKSPYPNN